MPISHLKLLLEAGSVSVTKLAPSINPGDRQYRQHGCGGLRKSRRNQGAFDFITMPTVLTVVEVGFRALRGPQRLQSADLRPLSHLTPERLNFNSRRPKMSGRHAGGRQAPGVFGRHAKRHLSKRCAGAPKHC